MRSEPIRIEDGGPSLAGELRTPAGEPPFPVVVHGPGWLGRFGTASYRPYHEALTAAGFAVVAFDYRGFGDSEGDATTLDPADQVEDWARAVAWASSDRRVDGGRLGVFGTGGTGGGNAILVAARTRVVRAIVAQVPIADGEDWLRRMRTPEEWRAFLADVSEDRRRRDRGEPGTLVAARGQLTVAREDRGDWKRDVGAGVPDRVTMASAEALMRYRPVDARPQAPTMIVAVEGDTVTPTDHALTLYEAAAAPKRFVLQRGTTHYRAYTDHRTVVVPMIVDWFERHVLGDVHAPTPAEEMVTVP